MNSHTIDAKTFQKLFLAGANRINSRKDYINELNVFPVPDGDTGTNMSLTILAAAKEVGAVAEPTMATICKAISNGSLRGARGNSGVILSQLFRGFTKAVSKADSLGKDEITAGFTRAVETAYKAVMKPKEGTILTVAKGMADKAEELVDEDMDVIAFCEAIVAYGYEVLSKTPDMLPVLKEAGVVDSGGQGLMEVLQGIVDALTGKVTDIEVPAEAASMSSAVISAPKTDISTADIKFGYCTEFIILLDKPLTKEDEKGLKKFFLSIGDSLVLVADEEICKVHVHTNHPGEAFEKALTFGALSNMKIDNMRLEHQEKLFKLSEKEFLKLVLHICSDLSDLELKLSNVEVRFTRRNYENIAQKATVLTTMLSNPKIAPVLAFTHCGMFSDPQLAYRMSMDYAEEQEKKAAELASKQKEVNPDGKGNPPDPGSGQED